MNKALLAGGWMAVVLAATTGCLRVDGLPEAAGGSEAAAWESLTAGGRVVAACKRGDVLRDRADACLAVAGYYERGVFGFPRDPRRAAALWESAVDILAVSCEGGVASDCTAAAAAMSQALRPGGAPGAAEAEAAPWMIEYAEEGCRGGDPSGCALLGVVFEHGVGVAPDRTRSGAYHDRACGGGHRQSCLVLASRAEGRDAVSAYERACRAGSGFGCAAAAQRHRRGAAVERSVEKAGVLFARGCSMGDPASCVLGAEMYANDGVPDRRRAAELAWAGCKQGIAGGCVVLGEIFEREEERGRAREAYRRACELGEEKACAHARDLRERREAERPAEYLEVEGEGEGEGD